MNKRNYAKSNRKQNRREVEIPNDRRETVKQRDLDRKAARNQKERFNSGFIPE